MTVAACYIIAFVVAAWVAETLAAVTSALTSWHIMGILSAITLAGLAALFAAGRTLMPR